jgi:hypothetical protein
MKFKALVSAVALAATGLANAAISTNTNGEGYSEVFVSVWNGNASIIIDLGLDSSILSTGNLTSALSYTLSSDSNWSTFLSKAGTGALSWSVQAVDYGNGNGWDTAAVGQEAKAGTSTGIPRRNAALDAYLGDQNYVISQTNLGIDPNVNVSVIAVAGTDGYWGNVDSYQTQQTTGFTKTSNAIGATAHLFYFDEVDNSNGVPFYQWNTTTTTVSLTNASGVYTLSFLPAAAVPEPEGFALALVGLAAVGFVARRRSV